jgi:hypothetical protein
MLPFLSPPLSKIEVNMNWMPPIDVLFIKPLGLELIYVHMFSIINRNHPVLVEKDYSHPAQA